MTGLFSIRSGTYVVPVGGVPDGLAQECRKVSGQPDEMKCPPIKVCTPDPYTPP